MEKQLGNIGTGWNEWKVRVFFFKIFFDVDHF